MHPLRGTLKSVRPAPGLTDYQQLAMIRRLTLYPFRLADMEELLGIQLLPDRLLVAVLTADGSFSRGTHTIRRYGTKIVPIVLSSGGRWHRAEPSIMWHADSDPELIVSRERTDWPSKEDWELICHRPGSSSQPMDNAARKAQGYWRG